MLRAREGDDDAFDRLMERNRQTVLNLVYRFVGNSNEAEDLAQEVFLKIYRSKERYLPKAKFTTWLYRITANLCLNYRRDQKRRRMFPLTLVGEDREADHERKHSQQQPERPGDRLDREEIRFQVRDALNSLPENQRIALILSKYEELPYREIAEIVDSTEKAIKSLLHRARTNLRTQLHRYVTPPKTPETP